MIGRLIEHQQVWLHGEELSEVGTHHPAARIFFGGLVEVIGFEAEAMEDFFSFRLKLIAIEGVELVLGLGEVRMREVTRSLVFTHGAKNSDHFWGDSHGDFNDGFVGRFALRQRYRGW